jgi:hypothetical protein
MVMTDAYRVVYPRRFVARGGELRFTAAAEAFRVGGLETSAISVYRRRGDSVERLTGAQVTGIPGAYDVTFPGTPGEATYWVVSEPAVRRPEIRPVPEPPAWAGKEAELLIVSHPHFVQGLQELVDRRRAQGWSVEVVDTETLYAHYGNGDFGADAISSFLRATAPALGTTHLLLVGGDTYDYFDVKGAGSVSFVPSPYTATGDLVRWAPADSLFADLDQDGIQDLAVGRFPVRTLAELDLMVDKTLAYEDRAAAAGRALFAADAQDPNASLSFMASSEQLVSLLPPAWDVERVYLDHLPTSEARAQLLSAFDLGPNLVSYMGHSGPQEWSFQGLFTASDAAGLQNAGNPSIVTQWGCWTTYYVVPSYSTLGHQLLLSGEQGAAAVLGAATLTEASSEEALAGELFHRLFSPGWTLGEALRASKQALVEQASPAVRDVVLGWTLLGDPTLVMVP